MAGIFSLNSTQSRLVLLETVLNWVQMPEQMPAGNSATAGIDTGSPAQKSNLLTTVPLITESILRLGIIWEIPEKNPPDHLQAELGLSHMWPKLVLGQLGPYKLGLYQTWPI